MLAAAADRTLGLVIVALAVLTSTVRSATSVNKEVFTSLALALNRLGLAAEIA
jgi:hypothetical protein